MRKTNGTTKSEQGFYIGDICYVLSEELYHETWGDKHQFSDGEFKDPKTGLTVVVAGTAWGDGEYADNEGNHYPVDAGVIGVVPLELIADLSGLESGRVCVGAGEATLECVDGVFTIQTPKDGVVHIDTNAEDWDDEDSDAEDDYESMDPGDFIKKYI